mmetsp:Transcript_22015/g.32814  ORF Transcript_22015/g.32814 Transcript_22015/m.32814 type:complete len:241 (+) Transcript_22015:1-723(+)
MKAAVDAGKRLHRIVTTNHEFTSIRGLAAVGLGGFFLGLVMMMGIQFMIWSPTLRQLGSYLLSLSVFHMLEFLLTAFFNRETLTFSSYLLDHGREYHMALAFSALEYLVECLLFPSLKQITMVRNIGIVVAFMGQAIRTRAMWEAGSNFTHQIAERKKENHKLVVDGVYRYCRHPSYCGWFWWAIGTQIILLNPVSTVAYAYVAWKFFENRIAVEEEYLADFFPNYNEYRAEVWSGIPGI